MDKILVEIVAIVGRTYEGLVQWLKKHNLSVPDMDEIADITVDIIKAYRDNDLLKAKEITERIIQVTNSSPELAQDVIKEFGRLAETYMALLDVVNNFLDKSREEKESENRDSEKR